MALESPLSRTQSRLGREQTLGFISPWHQAARLRDAAAHFPTDYISNRIFILYVARAASFSRVGGSSWSFPV